MSVVIGPGGVHIAPMGDGPFPIRYMLGVDAETAPQFENLGYLTIKDGLSFADDDNNIRDRHGPVAAAAWTKGATLTLTSDGMTPAMFELLTGCSYPHPKENTVIDKKKFEKYTARDVANSLCGHHIGALVKVKTDQGVEITDVLTGIHVGQYPNSRHGIEKDKVRVTFEHYVHGWENNNHVAEVLLDGDSPVAIRYPVPD